MRADLRKDLLSGFQDKSGYPAAQLSSYEASIATALEEKGEVRVDDLEEGEPRSAAALSVLGALENSGLVCREGRSYFLEEDVDTDDFTDALQDVSTEFDEGYELFF